MKKWLKKLRPVFVIAWWSVITIGLLISTVAAVNYQDHLPVKKFTIDIDKSNGIFFLNEEDVNQILKDNNFEKLIGQGLQQVDYHRLEQIMLHNPFVNQSQIFVDANGNVSIHLTQRKPILRVINNLGVSFYIDESGVKMPLNNNFTARVVVATGFISDDGQLNNTSDTATINSLYQLATYINTDSILQALIQQIYVNENKEFVLVPVIGNNHILFGKAEDVQNKFDRLKIFYNNGWSKTGFADYSELNLKFKNELYAVKRGMIVEMPTKDSSTISIDTTQTIKPNNQ